MATEQTTKILVTPEMLEAGIAEFICDCGAAVHLEEVARIYRAMRALEPEGIVAEVIRNAD